MPIVDSQTRVLCENQTILSPSPVSCRLASHRKSKAKLWTKPLKQYLIRIVMAKTWIEKRVNKDKKIALPSRSYPGYQRFYSLACDEELRRPQTEDTSGEARVTFFKTWPKPETAHEKPLAPRVSRPCHWLKIIFLKSYLVLHHCCPVHKSKPNCT